MKNKILLLLGFLLFTLAPWHATFVSAATLDQIRLSFQHDPKTTMTVMWRTEGNLTPRVQYGTTTNYGSETVGTTSPAVLDGFFYNTVELTGLTPGTTYHYRVSGDSTIWSDGFTFRTAPNGPADFSFTAFGDNGTGAEGGRAPNQMKDLVAAQNPAFHLLIGDLTYADGDRCNGRPCQKERWEEWFKEIERFSRTIPMMPTIGNHEMKDDVKFSSGETFYQRALALPATPSELYYSFDYGDVHFIALDSNDWRALRRGGAQYNWLQTDLAATTKKFKVVFFHHLAYSSGGEHEDIESIQQETTPLFDQYDVDLVINGHNHHYERTYPLRYGAKDAPVITSTSRTEYTGADGVVYVITGGGGRGIYRFGTSQPNWSAARCECHEMIKIEVDDAGILTVRTIKIDGTEIDRFTINKTATSSTSISSTQTTEQSTSPSPSVAPPAASTQSGTQTQPTATASGTGFATAQTIRGFNFAVWWHDALEQSSARRSLDNLAATGGNFAVFAPFWYQDNKTATVITRRSDKTATDASLVSAIRYAKSIGLKVGLKPMVDSRDSTWRGEFQPANPDAWFQSYKDFILNYARLAQAEGVDYIAIGTEFTKLTKPPYSNNWRTIIRDIREIYHGPLTYAANWGKRSDGEYYQIDFWDALDSIGIDGYFPLATTNNPTVPDITSAWTFINSGGAQNWFSDIKALHDRFQKPVILTEIGALSCDGTAKKPWEYPCGTNLDLQEQADIYEGTLRFWKDTDWMQGYWFWRWDANPNAGGSSNTDFMIQGKPAEQVLNRIWHTASTSSTTQTTQSSSGTTSSTTSQTGTTSNNTSSGTSTNSSSTSTATAQTGSPSGGSSSSVPASPSSSPGAAIAPSASAPTTSTFPTSNGSTTLSPRPYPLDPRPFSYGLPRRPLPVEKNAALTLRTELINFFPRGRVPILRAHWYKYVNAYLYGGYPPNVIARGLKLNGKVVHPSIPWTAWRRSPDYQKYMTF